MTFRNADQGARGLTRLVWVAVALAACASPAPTLAPSPSAHIDPTGILLVGVEEEVQIGPIPRRLANAFDDAMLLAETNGDDLGYPWIDPASGELVLSVVTPRGRDLVDAADITVPYRSRDVAHGIAELERIQDDVTSLGARGVADAQLITATLPDFRDNRALIVISAMSVPLLEYLAGHYPVDGIAVQVEPDGASLIGP